MQASILVMDLTILLSFARAKKALADSGLIGLNEWEGPELTNIVLTALIALTRIAFLLGAGINEGAAQQKRKKNR